MWIFNSNKKNKPINMEMIRNIYVEENEVHFFVNQNLGGYWKFSSNDEANEIFEKILVEIGAIKIE